MTLSFKEWLKLNEMMGSTGVVTGHHKPKVKNQTFNYQGAMGSPGVSIEGEPIKNWTKKDGRRKKSKRS